MVESKLVCVSLVVTEVSAGDEFIKDGVVLVHHFGYRQHIRE